MSCTLWGWWILASVLVWSLPWGRDQNSGWSSTMSTKSPVESSPTYSPCASVFRPVLAWGSILAIKAAADSPDGVAMRPDASHPWPGFVAVLASAPVGATEILGICLIAVAYGIEPRNTNTTQRRRRTAVNAACHSPFLTTVACYSPCCRPAVWLPDTADICWNLECPGKGSHPSNGSLP